VANGTSLAAWVQQVSMTFGFCITVLAYAIGHHSGAQINCAVTFGLVLARELPIAQALVNFLAQLCGSCSGAALLIFLKDEGLDRTGGLGTNSLAPGVRWQQALGGEILCTFLLMYVVMETAVNTKSADNRALAPLAIGMAVYLAHSVLIPIDGCSINPTRTIGPALAASFRNTDTKAIWKDMWIFWVGPCAGTALGVVVYKVMNPHIAAFDATGIEYAKYEIYHQKYHRYHQRYHHCAVKIQAVERGRQARTQISQGSPLRLPGTTSLPALHLTGKFKKSHHAKNRVHVRSDIP
jgi:MIP family channel proteins